MKIKTKIGDVFLIPTNKGYGLGQIVAKRKGELYVLIYDFLSQKENILPEEVLSQKPLFAALTLDAKLWHGDWPIIGNIQENLSIIPQPVFKVGHKGEIYLESRDRSVFRLATEKEILELRFRRVSSPAVLDSAFKAYHGIGEWNIRYDDLFYNYALESSRILETAH